MVRLIATLKPQKKSEIFYLQHLATPTGYCSTKSMLQQTFFVAWYQLSNILVIEASSLCFQPILYTHLQLIVSKCCPPMTVSYGERHENHREPSLGWWWVIKHFPSKMLQEPLCCSCSMRPSIVMKRENTRGQHFSSLFLNKGIEFQQAFHIWQETLLF